MHSRSSSAGYALHWDPGCYSANSVAQYAIAMAALADIAFGGSEAVLDVGCGDGKITAELARRVPAGRVLGIDASARMIDFARATHGAAPNLSFALEDVQVLGHPGEFDLAVSTFCLQWVPDKRAAFAGIRAALKSGGRLLALMPRRSAELAALRRTLTGEPRWAHYFADFEDPSAAAEDTRYDEHATAAGFEVIALGTEATPVDFPSARAFSDFLAALTPHLDRLPDAAQRQAFMYELVARFLALVPARSGAAATYTYVCTRLRATARGAR